MSRAISKLPTRVVMPCRRCGGLRRVTFDQLDAAQQARAPFGAIHPCPDCGEDAEIVEIESRRRSVIVDLLPEER